MHQFLIGLFVVNADYASCHKEGFRDKTVCDCGGEWSLYRPDILFCCQFACVGLKNLYI